MLICLARVMGGAWVSERSWINRKESRLELSYSAAK